MAIDKKDQLAGEEALTKLRDLLADFPIAFMVTADATETHARPIGLVGDRQQFDGTLWFITDRRSRKVDQILRGAQATLVFQNDERGTYAHMRGTATIIEDRRRLAELYTPDQRTWFPEGLEDPHMTLVRFDVSDADYWDGHSSLVRRAAAFLTAVVTGQPGREGHTGVAQLTTQRFNSGRNQGNSAQQPEVIDGEEIHNQEVSDQEGHQEERAEARREKDHGQEDREASQR